MIPLTLDKRSTSALHWKDSLVGSLELLQEIKVIQSKCDLVIAKPNKQMHR